MKWDRVLLSAHPAEEDLSSIHDHSCDISLSYVKRGATPRITNPTRITQKIKADMCRRNSQSQNNPIYEQRTDHSRGH